MLVASDKIQYHDSLWNMYIQDVSGLSVIMKCINEKFKFVFKELAHLWKLLLKMSVTSLLNVLILVLQLSFELAFVHPLNHFVDLLQVIKKNKLRNMKPISLSILRIERMSQSCKVFGIFPLIVFRKRIFFSNCFFLSLLSCFIINFYMNVCKDRPCFKA